MPVSRKDLTDAVLHLIQSRPNHRSNAKAIASYLIDQRRTKELDALLRNVEQARYDRSGILEVYATAARPLTEAAKGQIRKLFDAREVLVHEIIDESVKGGVRLKALDKTADLSIATKLQQLRRSR